MSQATIRFHRVVQNTQAVAPFVPDQEHMVSEVSFTLDSNGRTYPDMSVAIRQPSGTNYATEPIEVERPSGIVGNWNQNAFRDAVEDYYRRALGSAFGGLGIGTVMRGNTMNHEHVVEIEIPD